MIQAGDGRQAIGGVRGWWWLILVLAAIGGTAGYLGSKLIEPIHQATTTLLVGDLTNIPNVTKDDMDASRTIATTYGALIRRQAVLGSVIRELGLRTSWQELKNQVHVDIPTNDTAVIGVTVFAGSPAQARAIAAAVADQVVEFGPIGAGGQQADTQPFASRLTRELQETITRGGERVERLQTALASARSPQAAGRLLTKIQEQVRLIIEWQGNYRSLLPFVSAHGSPNTVQVLQPAEATAAPIRPDIAVNAALGTMTGVSTGFGITFALALRRSRRWRHAPRGGQRSQTLFTSAGRRHLPKSQLEGAVVEIMDLDPWVRELADPPFTSATGLNSPTPSRGG